MGICIMDYHTRHTQEEFLKFVYAKLKPLEDDKHFPAAGLKFVSNQLLLEFDAPHLIKRCEHCNKKMYEDVISTKKNLNSTPYCRTCYPKLKHKKATITIESLQKKFYSKGKKSKKKGS